MYLYWIITNKKRNGDSMKKALVIIDVQNDYFKEGRMALHSPEQALANINKLEASFIEKQLPIIYIQHINDQEAADFFERGTKGVRLHEQLKTTHIRRISFFSAKVTSVKPDWSVKPVLPPLQYS